MGQFFVADRIYTMDSPNEYFRAMEVVDGRISHLFDSDSFSPIKNKLESIIELQGYVLPGFIDSHIHTLSYGKYLEQINLRPVTSIYELVQLVSERAKSTPDGEWILGRGWNQEQFSEQRLPSKEDLDGISTSSPIYLRRVCGHVLLGNSALLEEIGITKDTPDPIGGSIDRDENGNPTGILRETALDLVDDVMPESPMGDKIRWLRNAQARLNALGITSVHTLDEKCYPVYHTFKNNLTLRVYFCPDYKKLDLLYEFEPNAKTGWGDDILRLGRAKLFADGSLGAQTAAMRDPYQNSTFSGIPTYPLEELTRIIKELDGLGWQIETHAIGDKAAEMVLDSYESIYRSEYRPVLTHCQILAKDLIERMARADVLASIQPFFIEVDMNVAERFVGQDRLQYSYAWNTLLDNGVHCVGGSDAPVDSPNPFHAIYAAVTRKKLNATPDQGWLPDQKLSVWQALRLYTRDAAYAEFQEHQKGVLKPGYFADFIVIDQDPFTCKETSLKDIQVLKTYLGGNQVYPTLARKSKKK